MATLNPLEQKARSSFIKGFFVALLIGLIIAGVVGFLYVQKLQEESERVKQQKSVLVLAKSVKSGDEINSEMVRLNTKVDGAVVPEHAVSSYDQLLKVFGINSAGQEENNNAVKDENNDSEKTIAVNKLIAKTDLYTNTIITSDMISLVNEAPTKDLRLEQYNMISLPVDLSSNETVDIRLRLPTGQDYIVISKKKVTIPDISGAPSSDTIQIKVTEDEMLTMSAAIVDAYKITGSKLYAVKYAEPGMQDKATATYIAPAETLQIIDKDPNIVRTARDALVAFANENNERYRRGIVTAIQEVDSETQKTNVESATASEASTQKSQRQQYLQGME